MVSRRIKLEIENAPSIKMITGVNGVSGEWNQFTRTIFERIARKINQVVTRKVLETPLLVKDFLLLGQDEFENIRFKYHLRTVDDFIDFLSQLSHPKPYNWISGKTLQAYWNNGNAKDKKLNVLLTFIGVEISEWDEWKMVKDTPQLKTSGPGKYSDNVNGTLKLIKKHFTGHYYRYFQKSDGSQVIIKAPFVIREDPHDIVAIDTKTGGHRYKSSYMIIRDGALYIECENIDWNEKETYIFNVGFEINPQLITGVSNTLNRKGQAIAIKNVLVKQEEPFNYKNSAAVELPLSGSYAPDSEEAQLVSFFRHSSDNIISTIHCHSLSELHSLWKGGLVRNELKAES
jgi:hypothetical protein